MLTHFIFLFHAFDFFFITLLFKLNFFSNTCRSNFHKIRRNVSNVMLRSNNAKCLQSP